jgi:hypothetical protein
MDEVKPAGSKDDNPTAVPIEKRRLVIDVPIVSVSARLDQLQFKRESEWEVARTMGRDGKPPEPRTGVEGMWWLKDADGAAVGRLYFQTFDDKTAQELDMNADYRIVVYKKQAPSP